MNPLPPCHDINAINYFIQQACTEMADDESDWLVIQKLRRCSNQTVFTRLDYLLQSDQPIERSVAAAVLGQFGVLVKDQKRMFSLAYFDKAKTVDRLLKALAEEQDTQVIGNIISALGHLSDLTALDALLKFANHPDEEIRFSVVHGLMNLNADRATQALLILMGDIDNDIRNWATFAIGTIREGDDTPQIREALFANINDPDEDTRFEALAGLALRRDRRIITRILDETAPEDRLLHSHVWDAFLAMLQALKDEIDDDRLAPLLNSVPADYQHTNN